MGKEQESLSEEIKKKDSDFDKKCWDTMKK